MSGGALSLGPSKDAYPSTISWVPAPINVSRSRIESMNIVDALAVSRLAAGPVCVFKGFRA